jgi:hypothetical protein
LVKPEDIGKVKSGPFALYMFNIAFQKIANSQKWTYTSWARPEFLTERHSGRQNALILLVDDFIGSGDTAVKAVEAYKQRWGNNSDRPVVLSLVAQQQAVTALSNIGVQVLAPIVRSRGITDSTRFRDILGTLGMMDAIERRIGVPRKFRRGYQKSEALVCMARCPNNTFPIYWWAHLASGQRWPAPFPRQ